MRISVIAIFLFLSPLAFSQEDPADLEDLESLFKNENDIGNPENDQPADIPSESFAPADNDTPDPNQDIIEQEPPSGVDAYTQPANEGDDFLEKLEQEEQRRAEIKKKRKKRKRKKRKRRRKLRARAKRLAKKMMAKAEKKKMDEETKRRNRQVAPMAFTWVRMAQNDLPQAILKTQSGVVGPFESYLYVSYQFQSNVGDFEPDFDLSTFGAATHLFTPNYHGFGLLGQHVATSAAGSTQYRMGAYYTFGGRLWNVVGYRIIPFIMFNDASANSGRFHLSFLFTMWGGLLIFDGGAHRTWKDNDPVNTLDLVLGLRLHGPLRFVFGLDHASGSRTKDAIFSGLELRIFY